MRSRILVIPAVTDLDAFSRLMAQLGHYFAHLNVERLTVPVDSGILPEAEAWLQSPVLPPGYADRVVGRIEVLRDRIALHPGPWHVDPFSQGSDIVLDWDTVESQEIPWASIKRRFRLDRTVFNIDWKGIRLGASHIAEAARIIAQGRQADRSQAAAFNSLAGRLGRARRAYVVGTGPSARQALEHDLSDGVRIICNTVILDDELMDHIRPNILTFADPIFHFGPSTYAQRFQEAVVEQAAKHDFSIITTERWVPLLRAHAPAVADRIIGLRQGNADWPDNFDLRNHAAVRPYPNVLTMLMLPIAATLADSLALIGFDGRDPRDSYFWRHGSTVQFDEELKDIRLVHPGFFEVDYADYYEEHVANLERLLSLLEARGKEIRPLAASFIPALRRRATSQSLERTSGTKQTHAALVSITPDWIGSFGHFGPFERRVHEVAAAAGLSHVALASAGLLDTDDWQVPTFSEATFASGSRFGPSGQRFEGELRTALAGLSLEPEAVVFFYTADVWHLPATLAVAIEHPGIRFVLNLQRSHDWIAKALEGGDLWVEGLVDLLRSCLDIASQMNVEICVDTEALQRDVEVLTGHVLRIWPMIAVSLASKSNGAGGNGNGSVHIVSPVQAQSAKGFPELVALADRLDSRIERGELRLTARWPVAGVRGVARSAERLEKRGVRLVRGNLTDEEFAELVASADVALIPYRINPFRTRTSAVAIDALLAGKPIVAVRGTWAGGLVERFGAGLTYTGGDAAEMESALSQVISHIGAYRRRVASIIDIVGAEHDPKRLIEFLQSGPRLLPPDINVRAQIDAVRDRANAMRQAYRWHAIGEESLRVAGVIREDDQQRAFDTRLDQVDASRPEKERRPRTRAPQVGKRWQRVAGWPIVSTNLSGVRRRAVRRAARGSLRVVLVTGGLLALLAGGLSVTGFIVPAILTVAMAVLIAVIGSLVVAARVERRT